jgi:hypothetical protein
MRGALLYRVAGRISLHTREQESFLPLESHLSLFFGDKKHGTRGSHPTRHPCLVSFNSRLGGTCGIRRPTPERRRFLVHMVED